MDESRPLLFSHAISAALGAGWLLLVYLTPAPPPSISLLRPEEAAAVEVEFEDERPKPATPAPEPETPPATEPEKAAAKASKDAAAAADAFGGASGGAGAMAGDVTNALRGVEVARGSGSGTGAGGGSGGGGGKAIITSGDPAGARTPGRGIDPSVTAAGENIGRVNASGSISRANVAVAAPTIVRSADGGASGRDMSRLGTFVRGRQAQLQYCYRDVGLVANPALAGSVSVAITLNAAGGVTEARVATRSWSGAGVAEAEACILARVKGWAFPASAKAGAETYNFSFLFNK